MAKTKKDKYTKTKSMIVSSRSFFGRKTEMEKQIEKWEDLGWELTHKRQIQGSKNKHELTFEYRMSDDEIATAKKWGRFGSIGCLTLVVLAIVGSIINNNIKTAQDEALVAPTRTALAALAGTQMAEANATALQVAINNTATATLWTPTFTPSLTYTPTNTNTPTITYTPSRTFTPTITFTPSITPTTTPTSTITNTPIPSNTPPPRTSTQRPATSAPPQNYYTTGSVNVRSCPRTDCEIVSKLTGGTQVSVIGMEEGATVSGSKVWQRVIVNGQQGYIHSSLLSRNAPAPKPIVQQQSSSPIPANSSPIINNPAPSNQFSPICSGNVYNCGDLTCSQISVYAATCGGDPSGLDGDNDGQYCESKCGG